MFPESLCREKSQNCSVQNMVRKVLECFYFYFFVVPPHPSWYVTYKVFHGELGERENEIKNAFFFSYPSLKALQP